MGPKTRENQYTRPPERAALESPQTVLALATPHTKWVRAIPNALAMHADDQNLDYGGGYSTTSYSAGGGAGGGGFVGGSQGGSQSNNAGKVWLPPRCILPIRFPH